MFDARDHYWIVAADWTRLWASARGAFVPVADDAYQAWLANHGAPSRIANEFELDQVLRQHGLSLGRGFSAEEALAALTAIDAGKVKAALGRDEIREVMEGDGAKLSALAGELARLEGSPPAGPSIEGVEKPKTAAEELSELKALFAVREAELVAKGILDPMEAGRADPSLKGR